MMNSVVGVLIRFHKESVALTGDIEAMFHQVRVHPKDLDAFRFLWWSNDNLKKNPVPYRMLVHILGATSSPACAGFCLKQTALDYGKHYDQFIRKIVLENFYVDDCLVSVDSTSKAITVLQQLTLLLQQGGFQITKWLTNSEAVLNEIPEVERSKNLQWHNLECTSSDCVLRVEWNHITDEFEVTVKPSKLSPLTRRGILSTVCSLFDPLGIISPVILIPKLILQELCKLGLSWDDPISEEHCHRWQLWLHNLSLLEQVHISRCFKPANFGSVVCAQLHHFSDASQLAFGACSYLRLVDENGRIHCSLLLGKSRLAPLKTVAIPRLELTAAVLAVKLHLLLRNEFNMSISSVTFWCDSTAALQILANSTKCFPTFVANRGATIVRIALKTSV